MTADMIKKSMKIMRFNQTNKRVDYDNGKVVGYPIKGAYKNIQNIPRKDTIRKGRMRITLILITMMQITIPIAKAKRTIQKIRYLFCGKYSIHLFYHKLLGLLQHAVFDLAIFSYISNTCWPFLIIHY